MRRLGNSKPDSDPALGRLVVEAHARQRIGLLSKEKRPELLNLCAFALVALAMPVALPVGGFDPLLAGGLIAAYALAARIEFHTGSGWTVPTELVFVPMLFLVPAPTVPLMVAAALVVGKAPEFLSGELSARRVAVRIGDAWYAVGPALVLSLAGATTPDWGDWPIYVGALAAQFAFDATTAMLRGSFGLGLKLRDHFRELGSVYLADALLAPIGLIAAFASAQSQWAFLLVLPLVGLLRGFARDREARIENALALSHAYRGTAHLLGEILTTTHEYTGHHSRSVVILAHQVGEELGLDEKALREIEFGALLHDVGKITVPNEIINKPGRLTDGEMALMRTHTMEGERMLERIGGALGEVGHIVRSHHEFYDGSGYPDGLRGREIPVSARVIACCDAFNAMTTDRPYRKAMPVEEALEELAANAGTQFDPNIVDVLTELVESWDAPTPNRDPARAPIREAPKPALA